MSATEISAFLEIISKFSKSEQQELIQLAEEAKSSVSTKQAIKN